jgi:hypothetical protein
VAEERGEERVITSISLPRSELAGSTRSRPSTTSAATPRPGGAPARRVPRTGVAAAGRALEPPRPPEPRRAGPRGAADGRLVAHARGAGGGSGLLIHHRISEEIDGAVSVGLRLDDLDNLPADRSEPDGRKTDPRGALDEADIVSEAERDYLVRKVWTERERTKRGNWRDVTYWSGRRVELNALTGPEFIAWLERKLLEEGVEKVVRTRGRWRSPSGAPGRGGA